MELIKRFKSYFPGNNSPKKKILFIQFFLKIDTHGIPDNNNFFRGQEDMPGLFTKRCLEKDNNVEVIFARYSDIYRKSNGNWYYDEIDLKDFNFVFFGFVMSFGTLPMLIQNYLNRNNVPYLRYGSYKMYSTKSWGMELVDSLGYNYIPSIYCRSLTKGVLVEIKEFGYPVIFKIPEIDKGKGVMKINNQLELIRAFKGDLTGHVIIQKYIPNDGDYRIITVKNKVELVCKREMTSDTEFRSNVALGGRAVPATVPNDVIKMCEEISKHVNCDIIGFDIIKDLRTGDHYVMEINDTPHFSTFVVVTGIDLPGVIVDYIFDNMK